MKKLLVLSLLLLFCMSGQAWAIDWQWADHLFNQELFDYNNNWAPISFPGVAEENYPSPGGSIGEMFDIEGAKAALDNDYLYFSLTSSYGYGRTFMRTWYDAGDFFFGFNGANTTFGINFLTGEIYENTATPYQIPDIRGGHYIYPAIREAIGAYKVDYENSLYIGNADMYMHEGLVETDVNGDTYVMEMRIQRSILTNAGVDLANAGMVSVHNTLSCGNDLLENDYDLGVIPEPGTMLLLGMGLLGSAYFIRKK